MSTQHRLSNSQRSALRRAISADPMWRDFRASTGTNLAMTSAQQCVDIAELFGIDWKSVISNARPSSPSTPANWAHASISRMGVTGAPAPAGALLHMGVTGAPEPQTSVAPPGATSTVDSAIIDAITAQLADHALAIHGTGTALEKARHAFAELRARVDVIERAAPRELHVTVGTSEPVNLGNVTPHPMFHTLLKLVALNVGGFRPNIWIAGPAGSGKTTAARMVADALAIPFFARGALSMPEELTGFMAPISQQYQTTPFVEMFAAGGLYLLDEVDGSDANALLQLNAALANGYMSLPDGRTIDRHPDFVCIGAGNTWGEGPSASYVARARLDAAFLDRFGFKLYWTYDRDLEASMCRNREWLEVFWKAREVIDALQIKALITPRSLMAGEAAIASGFSMREAADLTFLSTLTADQRSTIHTQLRGL